MEHYRIDQEFSNSYSLWKEMGSPQNPSAEQIEKLEKAGQLQLMTSPEWLNLKDGKAEIKTPMPRQAVSLIRIVW